MPAVSCGLQLCRYEPGQRFNRHYDDCVDMGGGLSTAYTLLVYLSGKETGLQGGETVFYGDYLLKKTLHHLSNRMVFRECFPVLSGHSNMYWNIS